MEHPAPFDLNQAIFQWRRELGAAEGMSAGSLDELEAHLRDSMEKLEAKGLSSEECFLVARSRLGPTAVLTREFAKPNAALVWTRRAFWMVAGVLSWDLVGRMTSSAVLLSMSFGHSFGLAQYQVMIFAIAASLLVPAVVAAAWWRAMVNPRSKPERWAQWFASHPIALWSVAFLAVPLGTGAYLLLLRYYVSRLGVSDFAQITLWKTWLTMFASMIVWPALLLWLLYRTKSLARAA